MKSKKTTFSNKIKKFIKKNPKPNSHLKTTHKPISRDKSGKRTKSRKIITYIMTIFSAGVFVISAFMYIVSVFYFNDTMIVQLEYTFPAWAILSLIFFVCLVLSFSMFNSVTSMSTEDRIHRTIRELKDEIEEKKSAEAEQKINSIRIDMESLTEEQKKQIFETIARIVENECSLPKK